MDPLEEAILSNAGDLGVDPGVELEQQAAATYNANKVKAPPAVAKSASEIDPSIAEIDRRYGFDDKAIEEELRTEALRAHEEENTKAVTEFLKKKDPEFGKEGQKFGQFLSDLVSVKDKEGKQVPEAQVATGTLSSMAAIAMVPGKWLESATNATVDLINAVGRKYNWGGGGDVLGHMEFFKEAQKQLPNGQTLAKVVEYAAPTVGLISRGSTAARAAVMGAAINSVVVDPDDQRLADMAKGTFLEKIPLVAETIDYLAYDPTDSQMTKRWKNALESLGVDALVAAGFGLARGARAKTKADVRAVNDVKDPVEKTVAEVSQSKAVEIVAPVTEAAPAEGKAIPVVQEAPVETVARQRETLKALGAEPTDELKTLEANLATAQAEPSEAIRTFKTKQATEQLLAKQTEQLDELARMRMNQLPEVQAAYIERAEAEVTRAADEMGIPKVVADEAAPRFDEVFEPAKPLSNNSEVVSAVGRLFKEVASTTQARGPMTLQDMYAMGGTLAQDVDFLKEVAGRQMGDLLSAEGTVAVKQLVSMLWDDFAAKAKLVPQGAKDLPVSATLAESFENLQRMNNIMAGYSEEAGRTLGIHRYLKEMLESGDPTVVQLVKNQMASKIVMERVRQAGGFEKISNYAALVDEVNELLKATDLEINKAGEIVKVAKWAKFGDGLVGYINTNRLNSVSLMGRIASSSVILTGRRILTSLNEAVVGKLIGADEATRFADVAADINGMMAATSEAAEVAAKTWKTGKSAGPTVNLDFEQLRVTALPEAGGASEAAKAWNAVGTILASGRRGIMTVESATGMLNYRGYVSGAAERAAGDLVGKEREAFIKNFLSDVPQDVHQAAIEAVEAVNLNGRISTPWIETLVNPASDLGRYHPITMFKKLFMPFANTRGRFLEEALSNVPGANLLVKDNARKFFNGTKAERAQVFAEMATGVETIGAIGYLIHNGVLTGGQPPDFKTQKVLADSTAGWKPYSVRVGDKYVEIPFADQTLKKIIDVSAYAMYSAKSASTEEAAHGEWVSLAGMAIGHILSPDDNLRTAGQITSVVSGYMEGRDMGDQARSLVASPLIGAIPAAGVMRDYNLAFGDRTQKDYKSADSMIDYLKVRMEAVIPGLSENVPVARNIFGEPIMAQSGNPLFGSFLASQDVKGEQVVENLRLLAGFYDLLPPAKQRGQVTFNIQEPRRSIQVGTVQVELTPEEYNEYSFEVGQRLNSNGQTLKDEFSEILVDKNSAVFDYVREHGYGNPGDAENFRHISAAITATYKARQDAVAVEFAARPEIQDRANEIMQAQDLSVRRGYQTLEFFGGNNVGQ